MNISLNVRSAKLAFWLSGGRSHIPRVVPHMTVWGENSIFLWPIDPDAFYE